MLSRLEVDNGCDRGTTSAAQTSRPVRTSTGPKATVDAGDAHKSRDEIIALFERNGRADFRAHFDWYYRDRGQEVPYSWFLRNKSKEVCGLCSVTIRPLRFGAATIRAGVTGNLLVDHKSKLYYGAYSLVRAMKSLVAENKVDILLGIPNQFAGPIFKRLGFHIIDRWRTHTLVFRSKELLMSRFGVGGRFASPLVDFCAALKRAVSTDSHLGLSRIRAVELRKADLSKLAFDTWPTPPGGFVLSPSAEYLTWRFLRHPSSQYAIFALEASTGESCGYVSIRRTTGRMWVTECSLDNRRLSEATALLCLCRTREAISSTVWVASLRSAPLTRSLSGCGFVPVPPSMGGYPDYPLVGFWRADHPLAREFSQAASWNLLPGFNDV